MNQHNHKYAPSHQISSICPNLHAAVPANTQFQHAYETAAEHLQHCPSAKSRRSNTSQAPNIALHTRKAPQLVHLTTVQHIYVTTGCAYVPVTSSGGYAYTNGQWVGTMWQKYVGKRSKLKMMHRCTSARMLYSSEVFRQRSFAGALAKPSLQRQPNNPSLGHRTPQTWRFFF